MAKKTTNAEQNETIDLGGPINVVGVFKVVPTKYLSVKGLYVGRVEMATYCMDGCNPKGSPDKYIVTSGLPGIKKVIGRYQSEQECREVCIRAARTFLKSLANVTA